MPSQVKVSWNTRLGDISEDEIRKRLRYFSLVTKVKTDIGIDFLCELMKDDVPSQKYFFVQAKGTQHFDESWGTSIKKRTVINWLNQPHPVFLVVYDEVNKDCYWMSVIEQFTKSWSKRIGTSSETIYIKIDKSHILEDGQNKNDEFIGRIKEDSFFVGLSRGHPQLLGEGYVRKIPIVSLSKGVMLNLKESIRISALFLIYHYLLNKNLKDAYLLCEFLTKLDQSHYNQFELFGHLNRMLGNKSKARESFKKAIEICEGDKKWDIRKAPSDPSIQEIIASLKKAIKSL